MKLRIEPDYQLFRHVKASGQANGSTWWVLLTPRGRVSIEVTIVVWPSAFASWALNANGKFYFSFSVGSIVVVSPVRHNWSAGHAYPRALAGAVYLDIASVKQGKTGPRYLIEEQWLPDAHKGEYARWFSLCSLKEEQAIARCAEVAEDMCRQMFYRARAGRADETQAE